MIHGHDEETWLALRRWLERSNWIASAIARRIDRSPAFDPDRWLDIWIADRDLLMEIMSNHAAGSMYALGTKLRALVAPQGAPTAPLLASFFRDLATMVRRPAPGV
jgi:hypothetical protein